MNDCLDLSYEQKLWENGTQLIIGIDEVGRGPLAGPVVVGAVIFDSAHTPIAGIHDSKKIAKKDLAPLTQQIKHSSSAWAIGQSSVEMINEKGIIYSLQHAISSAISSISSSLNIDFVDTSNLNQPTVNNQTSKPHTPLSNIQIIIDGLAYKDPTQFSDQCQHLHQQQCVTYQPKADGSVYSVAAASIIAKVYRDELMTQLAHQHTQYDWEKNAGYATNAHRKAIQEHGLTSEHRVLFCRNLHNVL